MCYRGGLETAGPPSILTVTAFQANMAHSPNVGLMLANVANVGLTLKQHWVNVSLELYLVISSVPNINAVNLCSIGYVGPHLIDVARMPISQSNASLNILIFPVCHSNTQHTQYYANINLMLGHTRHSLRC